MNRHQSELQTG